MCIQFNLLLAEKIIQFQKKENKDEETTEGKTIKKKNGYSKKGVLVAATALILSNSPVAFVTTFAEGKTNVQQENVTSFLEGELETEVQSSVQQENKNTEAKTTIDQSIYGNLLKNPTMKREGNTLPGWFSNSTE